MSVISKIRGFFSRHRNKFIVGGILVTGSIFLTKYAQQKLKEWQEKEMIDFLDRTRKQQHFENIGRTCNQTIINLKSTLIDKLSEIINTDNAIAELRTNQENRITVWDSLKVLLIAKVCCLIYAMSMLVIILKVQMNLVGGYLYKDSASIPVETQEKYLSLIQSFLNDGLNKLSSKVIEVCKNVMDAIDLKKQLRLCDVDALFWSLQTAIGEGEDNPVDKLSTYISLDLNDNIDSGDMYNILVRDTIDFLESEEVKYLTSQCINRGFIQIANHLSEFYVVNGSSKNNETYSNYDEDFNPRKPLAKLLPILNGIITKNSFPEKFLQELIYNEKAQLLGANIYESLL